MLGRAHTRGEKAERPVIVVSAGQHDHVLVGEREPTAPGMQGTSGVLVPVIAQNGLFKVVEAVGIIQAADPQPLIGKDMFHRRLPPVSAGR